jgi:hypothetical protein
MSGIDERAFERWAMDTLEGNPTAEWETIDTLWNNLRLVQKATRDRIVWRMAVMIAERADPASAVLGQLIAEIQAMSPPRVARTLLNIKLFREAAVYSVGRKDWIRGFAKRNGIDDKTVHQWMRKYPLAFKLAAEHPDWPDNRIFSPILWEPISFAGAGKLVAAEKVVHHTVLAGEGNLVAASEVVKAAAPKKS